MNQAKKSGATSGLFGSAGQQGRAQAEKGLDVTMNSSHWNRAGLRHEQLIKGARVSGHQLNRVAGQSKAGSTQSVSPRVAPQVVHRGPRG